jgi:hypothetical protein
MTDDRCEVILNKKFLRKFTKSESYSISFTQTSEVKLEGANPPYVPDIGNVWDG